MQFNRISLLVQFVLITGWISHLRTGGCEDIVTTERITTKTPTTKWITTEWPTTKETTTETPTTKTPANTPRIITVLNVKTTNNPTQFTKRFTIFTTKPTNGTSATTNVPTNGTSRGTTSRSTVTPSPSTVTSSPASTANYTTITTTSRTTVTVPVPTMPPYPVAPVVPWNVTYSHNENFCIMAIMAAQVDVFYQVEESRQIMKTGFDIPANATVNHQMSSCNVNSSQQILALNIESDRVKMGRVIFSFEKNQTLDSSSLNTIYITIEITANLFPGIKSSLIGKILSITGSSLDLFKTKNEHSFACKSLLTSNLSTTGSSFGPIISYQLIQWPIVGIDSFIINSTIGLSNTNIQAFMPSDQKVDTFMKADVCPEDGNQSSSNTVPIVVGGVLLFLVITVLSAYAIGRYRQMKNNQQTYSEM